MLARARLQSQDYAPAMCEACGPLALLSAASAVAVAPQLRRSRRRPGTYRTMIPGRPADSVISGGPILAMDQAGSRPESVAVRDGRILAVGTADEVAAHVGPAPRIPNSMGARCYRA